MFPTDCVPLLCLRLSRNRSHGRRKSGKCSENTTHTHRRPQTRSAQSSPWLSVRSGPGNPRLHTLSPNYAQSSISERQKIPQSLAALRDLSGGRYRTRTCDPPHVKRMLIPAELIVRISEHDVFYTMPAKLSRGILKFFQKLIGCTL